MSSGDNKSYFADRITTFTNNEPRDNSIYYRLNRSLQNLHQPSPPVQMKMPRRRIRKQTSMSILTQTSQPQLKPILKIFQCANMSSVFDDDYANFRKRRKDPGIFHSNSLQSRPAPVQNRSVQDLGAPRNRKGPGVFKQLQINKNDPILIGQPKDEVRIYLKTIQQQPRRIRDRGEQIKGHLVWEKPKPKTYLQRFRATRKLK